MLALPVTSRNKMSGFVKIYGSKLITSSLWDEAPEARLVFLSLLAIADATGYVDVPNERSLARVLNLEPNYVERGLAVLMAPDIGSRTDTHEGRRVLREGAGWRCVNYEKYREFRSAAQEATRVRVEKHRAKVVTSNAGNKKQVTGSTVTAEAEAEAEAKGDRSDSSETLRAAEPPAFKGMPLASATGETWDVPAELHRTWVPAFPGVNVEAEYRKAAAWLASNPTKRKTVRGMPKFMNGWLERAQNRGGSIPAQPARGAGARAAGELLFGVAK